MPESNLVDSDQGVLIAVPKTLAFDLQSDGDDSFNEAEHPRGQPENSGQFASAGGGAGGEGGGANKIKGTGAGAKPQPNFRGSLARETDGDTTQPVQSLNELYERAAKAEKPFKDLMTETAKKYNSEVQYTPEQYAEPGTILKSRSSAERKVAGELAGDPKLLRDVIRATVVSNDGEDTRRAASDFIGEHSDSILRVKDRYVNEMKGGYRDILINYRTPEGLVAEVQFNSKNMVKAKNETAHALYEQAREMVNPTREALEQLEQQMSKIYEHAYLSDGNSNWKQEGGKKKVPEQAHDAAPGIVPVRRYQLSQDDGPSFEAAVVEKDGKLVVMTNAEDGKWQETDALSFADLVMPEQNLTEWDVKAVEPGVLKDEEDGIAHRATDRRPVNDVNDIEYYTSEVIGPNRERTPEGFLICYDVPAARIGEMLYASHEVPGELGTNRDGSVRVTRSAAEVFDPRSMASLNGKPITDDHPPVDVDPKNWKFYTKGVVVKPRRGEDSMRDFLVVDMIIYDEDLINEIEDGKREVSCGYNPEYLQLIDRETREPIPGRGEQVKIRYNHLAVVPAGRCGPFCSIGDKKTVDASPPSGDAAFWSPTRARRFNRMLRRLGA